MRRLRVLAIAYACNPYKGSEFGVGWGWARAISLHHDVTVITADFQAKDIEDYYQKNPGQSNQPRFIYVQNKPWHYHPSPFWDKVESSLAKPLMNIAYQDWLQHAQRLAKLELASKHYDLVHLVTYVGWRFSGEFYKLEVPFVWGPIGGLMNTPKSLLSVLGYKGAIYYSGRNLVNSIQIATLLGPRRSLRKANGAVIAATTEIQVALKEYFGSSSHVICEVGIPDVAPAQIQNRNVAEPIRICWSGTHLPGKALQILLKAVASLSSEVAYSLEILGDGPSSSGWKKLAITLGIEKNCHWHGKMPRSQALEVMRTSHLFAITSLKDLTSTVAVEAATMALPIITLDHCGMSDLVTEQCGIKVSLGSEAQMIKGFADAISHLYANEQLRRKLSEGSLMRSKDYTWDKKMEYLDVVYEQAMGVPQS